MAWVGWLGWSLGWERLRAAAAPRILPTLRAVYVRKKGRGEKRKKEERRGGGEKAIGKLGKIKLETSEVK
jgi:hypothetical protein